MSKKIIVLILIISIISALNIPAFASEGDYIEYSVENGEASVTGFSESTFLQLSPDGELVIPSYINDIPVTAINSNVFNNCNELKSVTLPSNLERIGTYAFIGCEGLTDISIPDTVKYIGESAFNGCSNLASVKLSANLESVEETTFRRCESLASITIPDSVKTIGGNAFAGCMNLAEINIGNGVESIGANAFAMAPVTKITIPDSCKIIDEGAFNSCEFLAELDLGEGVQSIGYEAFSSCSITSLVIPDSVEEIGISAFLACRSLSDVTMSKNLKTLGESAFSSTAIKEVHLYDNVENIGARVFSQCLELKNIYVEEANPCYTSVDGHLFDKDKTRLMQYAAGKTDSSYTVPEGVTEIDPWVFDRTWQYLKEINLPSTLKTIGNYAFNMSGIKEIYIPAGVTYIGTGCFGHNGNLTKITVDKDNAAYTSIDGVLYDKTTTTLLCYPGGKTGESFVVPSGVTAIGQSAVSMNQNLITVVIPKGVTEIGMEAFSGCYSLKDIHLPDSIKIIGSGAFAMTGIESIVIPEGVSVLESIFDGCDNLKTIVLPKSITEIYYGVFPGYWENEAIIYYRGSEDDWNNINIYSDNDGLETHPVVYNFANKNNIAPIIRGCKLVGNNLNLNVDYSHNVSGSTVLIGIYDGNKLVKVETRYVNAGSTESEFSLLADSSYVGKTVKIMYWDDPNSMNDLCSGLSTTIK